MKFAILPLLVTVLMTTQPPTIGSNQQGIRFGELAFAPSLHLVIVPGGETRKVALVDSVNHNMEIVRGFRGGEDSSAAANEGITSADACRGSIYVIDADASLLYVVDPQRKEVVSSVQVATRPDQVRFVTSTNEIWVTEPGSQRIEMFRLPGQGTPIPQHVGFIAVDGTPESLAIDPGRNRAFANLSGDVTLSIDIKGDKILSRWPSGCGESRGIALDTKHHLAFVACAGGGVIVLDDESGRILGNAASGAGTHVIAYSETLGHLYVLQPENGHLEIVGISTAGTSKLLKTVTTVKHSNRVVADDREHVYVCDPASGKLVTYKDSLPSGL
jgi:DNA-binding beta-propeller fold protein YncE